MKKNLLIRNAIKEQGIKYWQVADILEIGADTFSRKLRHELPKEEQERIVKLIKKVGSKK